MLRYSLIGCNVLQEPWPPKLWMPMCVCVCVCVCARARARACVYVHTHTHHMTHTLGESCVALCEDHAKAEDAVKC